MLTNSFCHLPGIGLKKERALWARGIRTWDDFLNGCRSDDDDEGSDKLATLVEDSAEHLAASDPAWFERSMPTPELWRLFPEFRHTAAYLDIESNGVAGDRGRITTISLYDGQCVRTYVRGENLDDFARDVRAYRLLITYNGRAFDLPFMERYLGIKFDQAHIDLMHIMRSLGFRGGLKGAERAIGIKRGELDGVDGFFAVLLWREYRKTGDRRALETLLAYNVLDTVNLERLMVEAYNRKIEATPFGGERELELPEMPDLPYEPDAGVVDRLMETYLRMRG